jgi:hypothetical protein
MTKLMTAICGVCALATAGLAAAQTGKMDHDKTMMGKETKVTGCVAQSADMSHFMLNNAMMSGDMKEMKGEMKSMSYMLTGGDLKPHVGHKVEVTGMMNAGDKMMDKTTMDKDKMSKDSMPKPDMHSLDVKSVKMLSASCS